LGLPLTEHESLPPQPYHQATEKRCPGITENVMLIQEQGNMSNPVPEKRR